MLITFERKTIVARCARRAYQPDLLSFDYKRILLEKNNLRYYNNERTMVFTLFYFTTLALLPIGFC